MDNGQYQKYKSSPTGLSFIRVSQEGVEFLPEEMSALEWSLCVGCLILAFYAVYRLIRKNFFHPKSED